MPKEIIARISGQGTLLAGKKMTEYIICEIMGNEVKIPINKSMLKDYYSASKLKLTIELV